jgi:hypothetical protein
MVSGRIVRGNWAAVDADLIGRNGTAGIAATVVTAGLARAIAHARWTSAAVCTVDAATRLFRVLFQTDSGQTNVGARCKPFARASTNEA